MLGFTAELTMKSGEIAYSGGATRREAIENVVKSWIGDDDELADASIKVIDQPILMLFPGISS